MLRQVVSGNFHPQMLRGYLLLKSTVFWGVIGLCWLAYPEENRYSILSHTFSFLGSSDTKHNPQWWWLFSVAMLFWAVAMFPLIAYIRHRFAMISPRGAKVGAFFFGLGSVGIALVAIFPDVSGTIFGSVRWTKVHTNAAILVAIGFGLGIFWHAGLLLRDRFFRDPHPAFQHGRMLWPYLFWLSIVGVGVYYQVAWAFMYARLKAEAAAAGTKIGSSWSESLHTRYGFPLWENLVIYALFVFLVWFTLLLPAHARAEHRPRAQR